MKTILFAILFSFYLSTPILQDSFSGVGLEWIQNRSSVTLSADFSEEINYSFIDADNQILIQSSFIGPDNHEINTEHLASGDYTIECVYPSGNDEFSVYIDND